MTSGQPSLQIDVDRGGRGSVIVRLVGEFDIASVDMVRRALSEQGAGAKQTVIDLSQVTFFSTAGAGFLLAARAKARAAGGELVVRNPSRAARLVLELTGVLPLVCPDEPGAARPAALDPQVFSICDAVVASAIRVTGAAMGNSQVVDPATGALRIVAQHGFSSKFLDFFETVYDAESACGAALTAGQPVWVTNVATSPIFAGTPARDVMLEARCRAVASVPVLAHDGGVLAMISVHRHQATNWTDGQKSQLKELAASTSQLLRR